MDTCGIAVVAVSEAREGKGWRGEQGSELSPLLLQIIFGVIAIGSEYVIYLLVRQNTWYNS